METKHTDSNHWATNHKGSHEKSHLALEIILQIENYWELFFFQFWLFFPPESVADRIAQL